MQVVTPSQKQNSNKKLDAVLIMSSPAVTQVEASIFAMEEDEPTRKTRCSKLCLLPFARL